MARYDSMFASCDTASWWVQAIVVLRTRSASGQRRSTSLVVARRAPHSTRHVGCASRTTQHARSVRRDAGATRAARHPCRFLAPQDLGKVHGFAAMLNPRLYQIAGLERRDRELHQERCLMCLSLFVPKPGCIEHATCVHPGASPMSSAAENLLGCRVCVCVSI